MTSMLVACYSDLGDIISKIHLGLIPRRVSKSTAEQLVVPAEIWCRCREARILRKGWVIGSEITNIMVILHIQTQMIDERTDQVTVLYSSFFLELLSLLYKGAFVEERGNLSFSRGFKLR